MHVLIEESVGAATRRNLLRKMLSSEVFKFGEFTLKSGQLSPIYIDLRECFGYPDAMALTASGLQDLIESEQLDYTGIVGVPYAALPHSALVAQRCNKPLLIVRKEAKAYGTKKLVEGKYKSGDRVVIIEDVVTTGASIKEVVNELRKEGLVIEDVFCILDREQGGVEKLLKEENIKVHSLLNMETILTFLISSGKIDETQWSQIVKALNLSYAEPTKLSVGLELEDLDRFPLVNQPRLPLTQRTKQDLSNCSKKIFDIMMVKKTNLCLAADYTDAQQVLDMAEKAGPFILAFKVHADTIVDFSSEFTEKLVTLANNHNFLIIEDRKFADTGNTTLYQLTGYQQIAQWADLVTVHAIQGCDSIVSTFKQVIDNPKNRLSGILLISQLSTKGSLTMLPNYAKEAASIGVSNTDVVCGFICQARVASDSRLLHWTPGVNMDAKSDAAGQQWRGVEEALIRQQNDIVIVGRGVTQSKNPVQELKRYRDVAWDTFAGQENGL